MGRRVFRLAIFRENLMNFREEAVVLVKEILDEWLQNHDFNSAVTILEDYLTDQNTFYQAKLETKNAD